MEQPREPKFYPNNNGISYADIRIAELEKKVANLEEKLSKKYSKEKKTEDVCLFHWLRCLYKDYIEGKLAGENCPCETCPLVKECNTSPLNNFNSAGERVGIRLSHVINTMGTEKLI